MFNFVLSLCRQGVLYLGLVCLCPQLVFCAQSSFAEAQPNQGEEIALRSDQSDNGFGDSTVVLTMVMSARSGSQTTRELTIKTLERESAEVGDKSLVVFQTPRDIKGTALLSHAHLTEPDLQWLYLPGLKRVKRVSSSNKSGPFVGSEFAYEDFTALEAGKYSYSYLGQDEIEGTPVNIIECIPLFENSGYTKQIRYIDNTTDQVLKVEFFDRRGALLKTLTLSDYRHYEGAYWRAHKLEMRNAQTGKSTQLIYGPYTFKSGLTDRDFESSALRRIR